MNRPVLFLDRDNTLIANDGYLGDPAGVRLIDGAADAIARGRSLGFAIVTISNQSGVARGMFGEDDVRRVNARMDELLLADNPAAVIDRHEFCPDHPEAVVEAYRRDSDRRKPGAGMIYSAAAEMRIDLPRSWLIGDAPRDIEAGKRAGLRTILFRDPSLPPSPATEQGSAQAEYVTSSLKDAIDYIERQMSTQGAGTRSDQPAVPPGLGRLEEHVQKILHELRRRGRERSTDFSVSKLLAGITQILALAALFFAYLHRGELPVVQTILLLALVLEALTIALLLMGRTT
jgi:D,D-heptose 1,7-bisphosphate phosphatase